MSGIFATNAMALDFINVTKITKSNGNTTVSIERGYNNGEDHILFTSDFGYKGDLTAQETLEKVSMAASDNIIVRTSLASTTPVSGKMGKLGLLRQEAYYSNGLAGYVKELTRQLLEEGRLF